MIPKYVLPTETFVAPAERIVDGDTIVYPRGVCRLIGVDAPEVSHPKQPGQPLGLEAQQAVAGQLQQGSNTVLVFGRDRYGRMLCAVLDHQGYLVNLMLLESGLAETYLLEKSPFAGGFRDAEARAKAQKMGIWGLPKYERPHDYRQRMKAR